MDGQQNWAQCEIEKEKKRKEERRDPDKDRKRNIWNIKLCGVDIR